MPIRFVYTFFLLIFCCSAFAKLHPNSNKIIAAHFNIKDSIVFPGYKKMQTFVGDLNGDGIKDRLVIYEKTCPEDEAGSGGEAYCRRLAVFLSVNRFHDTLYGYNDKVIDCSNCGGMGVGDPFRDIVIKKDYFSVEQLYGACDKDFVVTTFHYDKSSKAIYLHRIGEEHYKCMFVDEKDIVTHSSKALDKGSKKIKFCDYVN